MIDEHEGYGRIKLIVLAILLFISFAMMGFSQKNVTLSFKSLAYAVIYPFHYAGVKSITSVKEFITSIKKNKELKGELKSAREMLEIYEKKINEYEKLKKENERLRSLLGIQSHIEYETVVAEVIAKSPQDYYKTIIVNRGKNSGIQKYMPVIAYQDNKQCLVGKIIDVQRYSSRIQPIIDQSSYTGAMLKDSRYSGILVGQSPILPYCLLQYIDKSAEMSYGDEVITSGMGGVYPKGILIGTVVSVSKKRYGIFQEAFVKPTVDFGRLEDVYIITKKTSKEEK